MHDIRRMGWGIVIGLVIGIGGTVWWHARRPIPVPVSLVNVDSLAQDNARLEALIARSAQDRVRLQRDWDRLRAERDSLARLSQAAIAELRAWRDSVPSPVTASPEELRALYASALVQLDKALLTIDQQKLALARARAVDSTAQLIELRLRGELADAKVQYANEQQVSADWKQRYERSQEALRQAQPWCGVKCGIVLGVGGTMLVAIGVRQVQLALQARSSAP